MVNTVSSYTSFLHKIMKLAGMQPKEVHIDSETIIHFWVNNNNNKNEDDDNNNDKKKKKKKKPLVLIQGFGGDGILTWQFQVLALRKKYDLYIPDLLFFGGSFTTCKTKITPRFHADCFAKALRKLGVEKCVVVGLSYGGFVGFQMAEHHPMVDSLVVTGSVLSLCESISSKALERIGFSSWAECMLPNSVEGVKAFLDFTSYSLPRMPNFFYKHFLEDLFISNRKERVGILENLVVKDEDVTNHQFRQRIHLLWGADDKIFNMEVANNLKERLGSKTELQVLKKAGHIAPLERPFAFNNCLNKLLDSLDIDETSTTNAS